MNQAPNEEGSVPDYHYGGASFSFGALVLNLEFRVSTGEEAESEKRKLEILSRILRGIEDAAKADDFAALVLSTKLLNGPSMDVILNRPALAANPCGCRGKE